MWNVILGESRTGGLRQLNVILRVNIDRTMTVILKTKLRKEALIMLLITILNFTIFLFQDETSD